MAEQRVKTVADIIKHLKSMPEDAPVYFDCPHCGRANGFSRVGLGVVIETRKKAAQSNG